MDVSVIIAILCLMIFVAFVGVNVVVIWHNRKSSKSEPHKFHDLVATQALVTIHNYDIKTLYFEHRVYPFQLEKEKEYIEHVCRMGLAKELYKYVKMETRVDEFTGEAIVRGSVRVVVEKEELGDD